MGNVVIKGFGKGKYYGVNLSNFGNVKGVQNVVITSNLSLITFEPKAMLTVSHYFFAYQSGSLYV